MKTAVKKWGNSLGIRIPKSVSEKLDLFDGSNIELIVTEDGLLVKKTHQEKLETLLNQINEDSIHYEVDFGDAEGKELW
ncbi:AbrB/MazE/SpoVT family DNA-binding domain-containing protein [bacterium]|nr:MAG: AbrB/MazE/SpoVT family DNA-binding domain-containing protein [bacterium]